MHPIAILRFLACLLAYGGMALTVEDYRPLINDVLIRVRTELCVLEPRVALVPHRKS